MEFEPDEMGKSLYRTPQIHEALKAAQEELHQLIRKRSELAKRISRIKRTIAGLANLFGDEVLDGELPELTNRKRTGK